MEHGWWSSERSRTREEAMSAFRNGWDSYQPKKSAGRSIEPRRRAVATGLRRQRPPSVRLDGATSPKTACELRRSWRPPRRSHALCGRCKPRGQSSILGSHRALRSELPLRWSWALIFARSAVPTSLGRESAEAAIKRVIREQDISDPQKQKRLAAYGAE